MVINKLLPKITDIPQDARWLTVVNTEENWLALQRLGFETFEPSQTRYDSPYISVPVGTSRYGNRIYSTTITNFSSSLYIDEHFNITKQFEKHYLQKESERCISFANKFREL